MIVFSPISSHLFSLCKSLSLYMAFFIYKDTSQIGVGPTLLQYDLIFTNYISNDLISRASHIVRGKEGEDVTI